MSLIHFQAASLNLSKEEMGVIERAREAYVDAHAFHVGEPNDRLSRNPENLPYCWLPEQQLLAYEDHRESSELGQVFKIANELHDWVDALVIVGSPAAVSTATCLLEASCDPYHNELSRADRGSKPRFYGIDGEADNDQIHSLTERLARGGYGDGAAERRWAMIVIDDHSQSIGLRSLVDYFVNQHRLMHQGFEQANLPHLITFITPQSGSTSREHEGHPSWSPASPVNRLNMSRSVETTWQIFSPIGLLPAAFLGLDCIQLLVGAARIHQHFRECESEENQVLRYAVANGKTNIICCHSPPIARLGKWFVSVTRRNDSSRQTQFESRDGLMNAISRWDALAGQRNESSLTVTHLDVDSVRTDSIKPYPDSDCQDSGAPDSSAHIDFQHTTFSELQKNERLNCIESVEVWSKAKQGTTVNQSYIEIPEVTPYWIGQWAQWMMLSAGLHELLERS